PVSSRSPLTSTQIPASLSTGADSRYSTPSPPLTPFTDEESLPGQTRSRPIRPNMPNPLCTGSRNRRFAPAVITVPPPSPNCERLGVYARAVATAAHGLVLGRARASRKAAFDGSRFTLDASWQRNRNHDRRSLCRHARRRRRAAGHEHHTHEDEDL